MEGSPNPLAWLALVLLIPFCFFAYARWSPLYAACVTLFGSAMFAPCLIGWDFPLLPALDKETLPAICSILACALYRSAALSAKPFRGPEALLLVWCCSTFVTAFTNGDVLVYGPRVIPGLTAYGGLSDCMTNLVTWFPPFYLGRCLIRTSRDLRVVFRFCAIAGLVYVVPILWELRMSPQLHRIFYGFHQHDFVQTVRASGYRPMVFMRHGLVVALFVCVTLVSAAVLVRTKTPLRPLFTSGRTVFVLVVVLLLCKSVGAIVEAMLIVPIVLFASTAAQGRLAVGIALVILSYPLARAMGWVPVEELASFMGQFVSPERVGSMFGRMLTEDDILNRARERLTFGWGGYGRIHVYSPVTGAQWSVIDGYWVAVLASEGVIGWACLFGMMLWPVVVAGMSLKRIADPRDRQLVAGLAVICAVYVFEWLPNSSVSASMTFLTGGLAGVVPRLLGRGGASHPTRALSTTAANPRPRRRAEMRSAVQSG